MVHLEQIQVWQVNNTPDYYGGVYESYVPAANAPTWATIRQNSGSQVTLFGGSPTNAVYEVFANYKDGFTWEQGMVITSLTYPDIVVDTISEDTRLRLIRLTANIQTTDNFVLWVDV